MGLLSTDDARAARDSLRRFWTNQSDEVLLFMPVRRRNEIPDTDDLERFWTDVDFITRRAMSIVEHTDYYGVAMPYQYVDFSATSMPCALGGRLEYLNKETVWSHPVFDTLEDVLTVSLHRENRAYATLLEITKRSAALAKDHHYVSPWPFGGILDTIAGLYPTESLLTDLLLQPALLGRVMDHITDIWIEAFHQDVRLIDAVGNPGHVCCWVGFWAPGTTFPVQEDLSYMISPQHFRSFCIPRLRRIVDALDYPLYHLDGDGALPHLEAILEMDGLPAVQWQPGAGKERIDQWYDVVRRIKSSGKSCQVFAEPWEIDSLVEAVGQENLLIVVKDASADQARALLSKYPSGEGANR